jgi:hypothetical protein
MYQPLAPCPSCRRHVRTTESACPFCAAALPRDLAAPAIRPARRRLGRAAAFAFGASVAVTGCGSEVSSDGIAGGVGGSNSDAGAYDAGPDDDGGTQAKYGAPPPPDDAGPDDDGGTQAKYGAPPPPDDAGPDDDGGSADLYGAPPSPPPPK